MLIAYPLAAINKAAWFDDDIHSNVCGVCALSLNTVAVHQDCSDFGYTQGGSRICYSAVRESISVYIQAGA